MKYSTIVFDLDGTLLDTLEDLRDSVNYALGKNNMPERTLDEIRSFVGNGIRKLIERSVNCGADDPKTDAVFDDFKEHYVKNCRNKTKPYDGILPMLEKLHSMGYKLAIVSNKADAAVKLLADDFFRGLISVSAGEREGVKRKPSPDTVNEVLKELGEKKENAVYVGDSDVDVKTAKNAGLTCISVLWGFRDKEFLTENGAETFISSPEEIFDLL